ncbi:MAG: asparaginase, partial [Thermoguttaceae bacterium]|nr:asparaginase [Thermoguttaceae bacterium]
KQRNIIADECKKTSEKQIVVIHGTDTMVETAAVVAGSCTGKTVVLTGAMVPIEFGNSDAFFNFGFALSAAKTLQAGVYVAMNGNVFAWDNVRKDRVRGVFETKQ